MIELKGDGDNVGKRGANFGGSKRHWMKSWV